MIRTLPSLFVSLERESSENGEPTAHGLYNFMKCYKFVACAYLLSDILPHLSRLSRIFQKESVDLSLIQPCLKTTIDTIKEYQHSPGPNLKKVEDVLATDLKDFRIEVTASQKEAFKSGIQMVFVQAIVDQQLHARFPCVEVLDAFSIFDPAHLASGGQEIESYGQEKLRVLVEMFGESADPDVEGGECTSEWEGLKRLMHNHYTSMTMRQMLKLLCTDQSLRDMFPQLTKLCAIAALIPMSTAECERAFSSMNRIKTDLRNRLKTSTLDCLMRIGIEGPPLANFNFERAADIWGAMHNRRLHIGHSDSSSSSS